MISAVCARCGGNPCNCWSIPSQIISDKPIKVDIVEAVKYDTVKPKLSLIPYHAMWGIGEALTYGANKYADFNYKKGGGLDWDRVFSANMRHLTQWNGGEDLDQESGLNHLKHAGACNVMLIDLIESKIGKDTRFK